MNEVRARQRCLAAFAARWGGEPEVVARAPGRVNIIGEHVDYNDGFVLPAAIDRDVVVALRGRSDGVFRVVAADVAEEDEFRPGGADRGEGWRAYIRGVTAGLQEAGVPLGGADVALAGDVPQGAGLSSSAALEVACAQGVLGLAGMTVEQLRVARLCQRAEVEWAGVECGIMDQYASVFGRAGEAIFLDCRWLRHRYVPLPDEVCLVATDSGVRRGLQRSAYNERVRQCQEAAELLGVTSLRDVTPEQFAEQSPQLPEPARRRARHVVQEIDRTQQAATALEAGDAVLLGELMNASHEGLRQDYEVSTPELDLLVTTARATPGVHGSRLTGAGFGGCTLSLVDREALPIFLEDLPRRYRERTGRNAVVHVLQAADGATADTLGESG